MQVLEALVAPTVMAVLFTALVVTVLRGLNPLRQQAGRAGADPPGAGAVERADEQPDGGADGADRPATATPSEPDTDG